jgi:hypothetical protein
MDIQPCLPACPQKKHLRELFSVSLSWIGQSPPLREYVASVVGNAHAPYEVDGVAAVKAALNHTKSKLDRVRLLDPSTPLAPPRNTHTMYRRHPKRQPACVRVAAWRSPLTCLPPPPFERNSTACRGSE